MNIQDYPNIRRPEFQNATPRYTGNWMSAWTLAARPMNLDDKQWADADCSGCCGAAPAATSSFEILTHNTFQEE